MVSLAATAGLAATGLLNGYWGQYSTLEGIRTHCDSGVDSITLGFVNNAPDTVDASGYPGTNFGPNCWGVYLGDNNVPSNLLSHCTTLQNDIPYCRSKGVKVILSIGGVYNSLTSNYYVKDNSTGTEFATFLYNAFGPYNSSWTGPRPFDASPDVHTAVDGFDFDIEINFPNAPYIEMVNTFRSLDSSLIMTAAPQCPTDPQYFYLKDLITQAAFDKLFIQFYNNPACDAIAGNSPGDKFNYDDWETVIANSAKSQSAKLYVGLPAIQEANETGYIDPNALKNLVCQYQGRSHFGGISLWDLSRGLVNNINGTGLWRRSRLDATPFLVLLPRQPRL
ncbi:hypothetical protein ACHAPV_007592 [Trichoderma viride]